MEKEHPDRQPVLPTDQSKMQSRFNLWSHVLVIMFIIFLCVHLAPDVDLSYFSHWGPIPNNRVNPMVHSDPAYSSGPEFSWDSIKPSTELDFVPCFKGEDVTFQCAVLDVPMDWNEKARVEGKGKRVQLAVIRLPAPVDVTGEKYGGAILINPGGPGGSGILAGMRIGPQITKIVDTKEKYFDVVSWDPRGVNNTKPRLSCFPDSLSGDVFKLATEVEGIEAIGSIWSRTKAHAMACSEAEDPNGMIAHMNTRVVVADMVAIIEGLGQWREKEASRILSEDGVSCKESEEVVSRTRWQKGKEKLLYWGFSYGTVLGATFAAMEPERVERIILDGVVDSTDYYSNTWEKDLQNTDEIVEKLYEYCSEAGPSRCPLNTGNSTAEEIRRVVEGLAEKLKEEPLPVLGPQGPEIITYSDLRNLVRGALYSTLQTAPMVADLLADIVYGNGTKFASRKSLGHVPSCPLQCDGEGKAETACESPAASWEGTSGVQCSDGPAVGHRNLDWYKLERKRLVGQSKWLGEAWAQIPLACVAWKPKAAWKITPDDIKGNTSHPILWIGNTLDPVTPLMNAHTMAKKFPGSVVLQQNSEGHCCIASPSLCTAKYIRNYFHTGELPSPGVVCQPEEKPLVGRVVNEAEKVYTVENIKVLEALKNIGEGRSGDGPLSPF